MNTITSEVTNLELSLELQKLGVPQVSIFEWSQPAGGGSWTLDKKIEPGHSNYKSPFYQTCSAFLASELLRILPFKIGGTENGGILCLSGTNVDEWVADYYDFYHGYASELVKNFDGLDKNPANELAKLLIYLIKQGLFTPQKEKEEKE